MSLLLALQGAGPPPNTDYVPGCYDYLEEEYEEQDGWLGSVPENEPVVATTGETPDEDDEDVGDWVFSPTDYVAELIAGGGEQPPEDDEEVFDWQSQPVEIAPDFIASCLDDPQEADEPDQDWQSGPVEDPPVAAPDFIVSCLEDSQETDEQEQEQDWQAGPFEDVPNRSGRSSRLKRIVDAKLTLKGTRSSTAVGRVIVQVHNEVRYDPPVDGYITIATTPTKSTTGKCWVTVSVVLTVRPEFTHATVNGINWLLSYSRVRARKSVTKTTTGKVRAHSSNYLHLTPAAQVTRYGRVEAHGTQNPTPLELVQIISAIRRKKT